MNSTTLKTDVETGRNDIYLSVAVVESEGYLYLRTDADDTPARKELRSDEYRAYAHGRTVHGQHPVEVAR